MNRTAKKEEIRDLLYTCAVIGQDGTWKWEKEARPDDTAYAPMDEMTDCRSLLRCLDYLEETCLDIFAQAIRAGYQGYQRTDGKGEFHKFDIVPRWDRELYLEVLRELCWK